MSSPSIFSARPGVSGLKNVRRVQSSVLRDLPRVKCKPDRGEFPEADLTHDFILFVEDIAEVHRVITTDAVVFDVLFVELYDALRFRRLLFLIRVAFCCRYLDACEVDSGTLERTGGTKHRCSLFGIRALAGEVEVG